MMPLSFAGTAVLMLASGPVGIAVGLVWLAVGWLGRWLARVLGLQARSTKTP
jgi:hypothetical protein